MYVSYEYYIAAFGGVKMEMEEFYAAERAAEAYIRYMTFPNGDVFGTADCAVKNAVCAAAEAYHDVMLGTSSGNGPIKSESNDGYSVTYASQGKDGEAAETLAHRKMYEAARIYLLLTGWLNRRIGGCCCGDK